MHHGVRLPKAAPLVPAGSGPEARLGPGNATRASRKLPHKIWNRHWAPKVAWRKHMTETRTAAIEALSADLTRTVGFVRALKQRYGVPDPASLPLLFRLLSGPKRPTELAELLHLDLSVVSRQLTSLSERGLVAKTRDPGDRRANQVEITDAGRALTAQVERIRTDFLANLVSEWDENDVRHFATYLHRLSESLDQHECIGR